WGVPADSSHDPERHCPSPNGGVEQAPCSASTPLVPFLTNPTSCAGPQRVGLRADSWQEPGTFVTAESTLPAVTGCERLRFTPSLSIQPDTNSADSPAGLHVDLEVPQNEGLEGLVESSLRKAVVTLPAGVSVSPSAATGLQACSPAQIGLHDASEPSCPEASKVGKVEITTPLLSDPLKGSVYVATQKENPFGSLLAIYVTAEADGALVKLAGHVELDRATGQITTTFDESPQLPFGELRLALFGGPRGALVTPESCGTFTTGASLSPWSGMSPASFSMPFQISAGCVSGFSPSFAGGTTNPRAGAYSPFVLSFSRSDADQGLAGLTTSLPPGMLAKIAGVPPCSDADANAGNCPEVSRVGSVMTAAAPRPHRLFRPGKVYLAGPYNGGPYGLAVVVPAIAGPYNLGIVVVRQSLRIDRHTAQVTDVSDPFPTILEGIPIKLRRVDVTIDRPSFTFNPTSCAPMAVAGTLSSTAGLSVAASSRFQVGGCGELPFKPSFKVSTSGRTSRIDGVSLTTKIVFPRTPAGSTQASSQANLAYVKVELPKALPSRLKTLQNACRAAQFEASPAGCPAASIVGHARVVSPVVPDPLEGSAYFISHGGEQFPSLIMILKGNGITLELVGTTLIRNGITSTTFKTAPD